MYRTHIPGEMMPAILLMMILMMPAPPDRAEQPAADLILTDGNIYTLDPALPRAQAVAVRGGRFLYVGDLAGALKHKGSSTRVVSLSGRTVVPGLTDAHGHVAGLGFAANRLDLTGTTSAREIARMVAAKAAAVKPGQWIRGRGWDQNDWEESSFPTRHLLDEAAPANPVALERIDGHATWTNSRAIELAGVTKGTADPSGGRIVRDAAGGATGIFVDAAEDLIAGRIPAPTRAETLEALRAGMGRCLEAGLTEVHDAGVSAEALEIYRELLVEGDYPFRIYAMLDADPALVDRQLARGPEVGLGGGRLTVRALKLYMDGALGSRGAALLAPYRDDAANTGLIRTDPARLREISARAAASGYQVCVHAIGDRGNRLTLDSMEPAIRASGGKDLRFRVEHAQVLAPEEIPRFAALKVIASMQPTHATSDMYWVEDRVGAKRAEGAYAWRSLLKTGARLTCGSDFPVESERPLLGFYAAVTRQDAKGWPAGGWHPDERLTREEALRCFTQDAAYAAFEEDSRGSIAPGKLADLTVLTDDIMRIPAPELLKASVAMTIVGGRIAYERK
jgi:hypothetical protein